MLLAKRSPLLVILAMALILAATLAFSHSASAGNERVCSDETINSGTFSKVVVASGTGCTLEGTVVVEGDVVAVGATTVKFHGIQIYGNVRVTGATGIRIQITDSEIGGNVTANGNNIKLGDGRNTGDIIIAQNTIGGNVEVKDNSAEDSILIGRCLALGNDIGGNVSVKNNAVDDVQIACNKIGGNVEVKANAVVRDVRLPGNTVAGNVTLMDNTSSNRFILGSFKGGGGDLPANTIFGNVIVTGNSNSIDRIIVGSHPDTEEGNTIFGHLTVMENTSANQVLISLNSVSRNLKCEDNTPGATLNDNTVVGKVHCGN